MKTLKLLFLFILLISASCKNDDDTPTNPIDLLPPATQTGENTFGCLLDGEVFLPDNAPNSTNSFYQFLNEKYFFTVRASNRDKDNNAISIALKTEEKQIVEGETYDLLEVVSGNAYGGYFFNSNLSYTSFEYTGKLFITKLDLENNIVSGTFWYDIEDANGQIHQIREGRFDMRFTQ